MNDETKTVDVQVPFSGFYESIHDEQINSAIENHFEWLHEEDGLEDTLTEEESDAIWSSDVNWSAIRNEYAKEYTEAFGNEFKLGLKFIELSSPKYYNFSTDRIFAEVAKHQIDKIRKQVEATDLWAETVKEQFTSRDGFSSFYSNDIKDEDWTKDVLDECQYGVLLETYIEVLANEGYACLGDNEWEYGLIENIEVSNFDSVSDAIDLIEKELANKEAQEVK